MKDKKKFMDDRLDERELFLRGTIYQHSCTVLFLLLLGNVFLKNGFGLPPIDSIIILAIALAILDIEMIYHEIYPISFKTQRTLFITLGIIGMVLVGLSGYHILIEQYPLISQNTFSEYGESLITGICFSSILLAFWIRQVYNKK